MSELLGKWKNEYNSLMTITSVDPNGTFTGTYSSTTGASGTYRVVGVYDTLPEREPTTNIPTQTLAFSISWRPIDQATVDPSWHYCSGFAGQLQILNGQATITSMYLLAENTASGDNYKAIAVSNSTFKKVSHTASKGTGKLRKALSKTAAKQVTFSLSAGTLAPNGATQWYAEVPIGTPGQRLKLMLDTGTENAWVTSAACTTEACSVHDRFNPETSSTYKAISDCPKEVSFGPWGDMSVILGSDVMELPMGDAGALTLEDRVSLQLAVKYEGEQFQQLACDGGLGIPSVVVSGDGQPTELLQSLLEQGVIDKGVASFWYDAASGEGSCILGGIDAEKLDPNTWNLMRLVPLSGSLNYLWSLTLDAFLCDGEPVASAVPFVLDTGSSWFKGGTAIINKLVSAITQNGELPTTLKSVAELAQYPDISLSLNGITYPLTPSQYFLYMPDTQEWVLGLHVLDGLPDDLLLVGTLFLETVYSAFFFDPKGQKRCAIGLAQRP